jgi:hypothetical protein
VASSEAGGRLDGGKLALVVQEIFGVLLEPGASGHPGLIGRAALLDPLMSVTVGLTFERTALTAFR